MLQTIIGLLGSWVAGTEVKSIIKGSAKRQALGAIWSIISSRGSDIAATTALIRMKSNHFATTSSRFVVAAHMADAIYPVWIAWHTCWTPSAALGDAWRDDSGFLPQSLAEPNLRRRRTG